MRDEQDMVYRGREDRIHIANGYRDDVGHNLAEELDRIMRHDAYAEGRESWEDSQAKQLCPGCYMTVIFDMAVHLAQSNGQSLSELGNTMSRVFAQLAQGGPEHREDVEVVQDTPAEVPVRQPDEVPYLDGFLPNADPILYLNTERKAMSDHDFAMSLVASERDNAYALSRYGLDSGLVTLL